MYLFNDSENVFHAILFDIDIDIVSKLLIMNKKNAAKLTDTPEESFRSEKWEFRKNEKVRRSETFFLTK